MDTQAQQRIMDANGIFQHSFLDSKTFFIYCYQQPPCITFVDRINTVKALDHIKQHHGDKIRSIYQYSKYEKSRRSSRSLRTVILLTDNRMLELASECCEILYTSEDGAGATALLHELSQFRRKEKRKKYCINLVSRDSYGMDLKELEIKKTRLDLGLYYEDDFLPVDQQIRKRLNKNGDKGIVLLHGLPGTAKTTYLRHLIGGIRKKVLFLSPAVAHNIMDPEFMDILIDNPDSVLVIEDAENIIMDRRINSRSCVSDLLNISDGLLADFLHVQVICTFNHPLSMIDSALMRKGRLIARYEFGRLSAVKAQRLSDHLGFTTTVTRPMTIAEITGQGEADYEATPQRQVIGFRRNNE